MRSAASAVLAGLVCGWCIVSQAHADFTGVFDVPTNASVGINSSYTVGNWTLSAIGAPASELRSPAPGQGYAQSITLGVGSSAGQADFTMTLPGLDSYRVSFTYSTLLDDPGDTVYYVVDGVATALAIQTSPIPTPWSGTSPQLTLSPGMTFGWRVLTSAGPGAGPNNAAFNLSAELVPEPGAWALCALGVCLGLLFRRRWKS